MKRLKLFLVLIFSIVLGLGSVSMVLASSFYSFTISNFIGDSGAGGVKGLVPGPAAGDAAAGKFLKADGTWTAPSGASFPLLAPDGSAAAPSYSNSSDPDTGFYWLSSGTMVFSGNGTADIKFSANDLKLRSDGTFQWTSGTIAAAGDVVLNRAGPGQLLLSSDSATTGTGILGSGATGLKQIYFDYTNTATVGAVTINKASGRAIIAAGASSVVITDSLATAASGCFVTLRANDATSLYLRSCVTTATNITITVGPAAATADLPVDFQLINHD